VVVDAMRDDLGVGLGGERRSRALQLGAQLVVVLDDAVVHDREPVLGDVRMRVALDGTPCVAQRVCAMPSLPWVGDWSIASCSMT
jgi:hypothetical protein